MARMAGLWLFLITPLFAAANARLEFALGVLQESRGDAESAAVHFESARLADPSAMPLVERAVACRLAKGDRSGAIGLFRELAAGRPDELDVQLGYADFLTQQGRGDALAGKLANETLEKALENHPGHPEIIRRLFSTDRPDAADILARLSPESPESVMLFASLSRSLHDSEDAEALAEVDRRLLLALESSPENPVLARKASDHFRNTERLEQAIEIIKQHTKAAPWSLDLRTRLGILEFSAKRDDDGEATLKEVLVIHPRKALAHQTLAKFYRLRERPEPASFHAAELLKIRGGSATEFIHLADEFLTNNESRKARLLLEKAVFHHPHNLELQMKLAVASHRDPETRDRASRLFREAEGGFSDDMEPNPAFLTSSAEALIESGQSRAAEERLKAAIRAYPPEAKAETATALRRMAALWEAEERNGDAARALRKRADALDP